VPWSEEEGVVVHRCGLADWCKHLGLHLATTMIPKRPRPRPASRRERREIERASLAWSRRHEPADVWALRVALQ